MNDDVIECNDCTLSFADVARSKEKAKQENMKIVVDSLKSFKTKNSKTCIDYLISSNKSKRRIAFKSA